MSDIYYLKYLKYKNKYLDLKSQLQEGGRRYPMETDKPTKFVTAVDQKVIAEYPEGIIVHHNDGTVKDKKGNLIGNYSPPNVDSFVMGSAKIIIKDIHYNVVNFKPIGMKSNPDGYEVLLALMAKHATIHDGASGRHNTRH